MDKTIEQIAEKLNMSYLYEDWARANFKADKTTKFPILINLLPISGTLSFKAGQVYDAPNRLFAFLDKTDFDFDSSRNGEVVERMKVLAKRFIAEVNRSVEFDTIAGDFNYSVVYDKLNVNLTGITLELRLKSRKGVCEDSL